MSMLRKQSLIDWHNGYKYQDKLNSPQPLVEVTAATIPKKKETVKLFYEMVCK